MTVRSKAGKSPINSMPGTPMDWIVLEPSPDPTTVTGETGVIEVAKSGETVAWTVIATGVGVGVAVGFGKGTMGSSGLFIRVKE